MIVHAGRYEEEGREGKGSAESGGVDVRGFRG